MVPSEKDSSEQRMWGSPTALRRSHARLFDEEPGERRRLWECALCNLELACCCAAFVAVIWLACQPDMESEDATLVGAVLGDWLGGQGLRGAGVGGGQP